MVEHSITLRWLRIAAGNLDRFYRDSLLRRILLRLAGLPTRWVRGSSLVDLFWQQDSNFFWRHSYLAHLFAAAGRHLYAGWDKTAAQLHLFRRGSLVAALGSGRQSLAAAPARAWPALFDFALAFAAVNLLLRPIRGGGSLQALLFWGGIFLLLAGLRLHLEGVAAALANSRFLRLAAVLFDPEGKGSPAAKNRPCFAGGIHWHPVALAAGLLAGSGFSLLPLKIGIKYAAAALAALAALFNPLYGLYVLAALLPFLPDLALLLWILLTVVSFFLYRLRRGGKLCPAALPIQPALTVFLLAIILYSLTSPTPGGSMRELGLHLSAAALMICLFNHLDSPRRLYVYLSLALFAGGFVSLYGLYQYAIGVPAQAAWVDSSHNPLLQTRVYSVFGNPNVLAEYLILIIPFGLAFFLAARGAGKKLLFACITAALGLTLLLTFSRGGWLGLAAALAVYVLLRDRRAFVLLLLLALAAGAALSAYMPGVLLQRVATIFSAADTSNLYRLLVWQEALNIARDFWMTGVGFGYKAFREIYPYYMLTRVKLPFHVHNTYLQYLVETGLPGLIALLALLLSTFKQGLQGLCRLPDGLLRCTLIAALAALAGLLVHALGEHVLYMPKIIFLFWINIGVMFLCIRLGGK